MKDVLCINLFSKNESPYVEHYKKVFEDNNITYDIVYFERYNMNYVEQENEIVFKKYCPTGGKKRKKIGIMLRYAIFIRKLISKKKYKKVVIFATNPAIMLFDKLLSRYRGEYILDIRDFTNENNRIFFNIEKKLITNSYATVISSNGFTDFLPKDQKYVLTHNVPMGDLKVDHTRKSVKQEKITIGFVGSIRYFDENIALINNFRNNDKYNIIYHGTFTIDCDIKTYCSKNKITNVFFGGRFNNDDKYMLYKDIDIINSIYGVQSIETTTAIPNRLYDACIYGCPLIVSKGTFLAELVQKYKLGIVVDVFKDDVKGILEEYMDSFDRETFYDACNIFMEIVRNDMRKHREVITDFVLN